MVKKETQNIELDELTSFCKRKGFVYPSGEIYGGLAGFWDYGHLGVELKNNLKKEWWQTHVREREDMAGIDGSIITNPNVWVASGHVASFVDVAVVCKKCGYKGKVDKHEADEAKCPKCSNKLENKGEFNPMFTTQVGPIREDSITSYLRPETAQLIFANFKAVQENARMQLPFGIAQVGKAFRNEISPREFLFRCREFEQMEIEYFIAPNQKCPYIEQMEDVEIAVFSETMQKENKEPIKMKIKEALKRGIIKKDWHAYFMALEYKWFLDLGADSTKFRIRQHYSEERSHYSTDTWDLEYNYPMGFRELSGFADRSTYDLMQHQKFSKISMAIQDAEKGKIVPEVVCEPSQGVERAFLVFLLSAYVMDEKRKNVVLKLHPKLSPVKAAVFPIVKKPEYEKICLDIVKELRKEWNVLYDKSGSIGRRYSRNDEIGTPMCITIDELATNENSVTIRDRDSTKQVKVKIVELREVMRRVIEGESLLKFGEEVKTRVKEA